MYKVNVISFDNSILSLFKKKKINWPQKTNIMSVSLSIYVTKNERKHQLNLLNKIKKKRMQWVQKYN